MRQSPSTLAVLCLSGLARAAGPDAAWSSDADGTRAIVAEMHADATARASLLQPSGSGHDGKQFTIAGDGFRLAISGMVQFRYTMNFRDSDSDGGGRDDFESGFTTRRTKVGFAGHIFDKALTYRIVGAFNRSTGDFGPEDAFMAYSFGNGFKLQWGQFKPPFMREELVSSSMQLAADRSLTNEVFNQDWTQGVQLAYEDESWRIRAAFSDGFRARDSDYTAPKRLYGNRLFRDGESDYAFTARAERLFSGDWKQFDDFTSPAGSTFAAMAAFAAHYEGGDSTTAAFGRSYDYFAWTGDVSLEGDGWNIFASGVGSYTDSAVGGSFGDYGVVVQGGIMIPDTRWEIFARYDALIPDEGQRGASGNDDWLNTVTTGVNYYWHGHAAKWTFDVQWFIDGANALSMPFPGIGHLGGDDAEIALRCQFQLMF